MATSFKRPQAHTAVLSAPTMQQATADPSLCRRLWTLTGKCGSVVACRFGGTACSSESMGPFEGGNLHYLHHTVTSGQVTGSENSPAHQQIGLKIYRPWPHPSEQDPVSPCCWDPNNTRRLYTYTSPDDQYQNQIDYILCSQRQRSSIHRELTVAHIMNSLLPNSDLN